MQGIKIGFYGMTHLGLVSAVAAASKGFAVIGYDANDALVKALQAHTFPIQEPGLLPLAVEHAVRLRFVSQLDDLLAADLIYVAIDVPTDQDNQSNLQPIRDALLVLRDRLQSHQCVIILSQVSPGFTREMNFPTTQLFYQVETLIFGRAIERATLPERLIVGCANKKELLPPSYLAFLSVFNCPLLVMDYESAELTKTAINMYLVSSVMTSNFLAELASAIGATWQDIVPALRLDKRIGNDAYLNPGLGISGGNLERDMQTLLAQGKKYHTSVELIKVWLAQSRYYQQWVWRCLQHTVLINNPKATIALWGLAYKADTHSIKNSPALALIAQLNESGANVRACDPWVDRASVSGVTHCDSLLETLVNAQALVVMTPRAAYADVPVGEILSRLSGRVIIDPYHRLKSDELLAAGFSVFTLGLTLGARQEKEKVSYA